MEDRKGWRLSELRRSLVTSKTSAKCAANTWTVEDGKAGYTQILSELTWNLAWKISAKLAATNAFCWRGQSLVKRSWIRLKILQKICCKYFSKYQVLYQKRQSWLAKREPQVRRTSRLETTLTGSDGEGVRVAAPWLHVIPCGGCLIYATPRCFSVSGCLFNLGCLLPHSSHPISPSL